LALFLISINVLRERRDKVILDSDLWVMFETVMALVRTFLAVLIAASLALLPVRFVAADSVAGGVEMSAGVMSGTSAAMHDCCPEQSKTCDMTVDQCNSMAACASQSFSIAIVSFAEFVYPPFGAMRASSAADNAFHPAAIRPPVPPPRF
jgi:hypothetical protein